MKLSELMSSFKFYAIFFFFLCWHKNSVKLWVLRCFGTVPVCATAYLHALSKMIGIQMHIAANQKKTMPLLRRSLRSALYIMCHPHVHNIPVPSSRIISAGMLFSWVPNWYTFSANSSVHFLVKCSLVFWPNIRLKSSSIWKIKEEKN